jgi:hypothetical protein
MLQAFDDAGVRFLIVGAYAVAAHARPRATGDIDIWVERSEDNARRIYQALAHFGAPMGQIDERTFIEEDVIFQIGVPPVRIDILTGIDGVAFDEAWPNRIEANVGRVTTRMIGRLDLIRNKRASGRPKDLADLERLERDQ